MNAIDVKNIEKVKTEIENLPEEFYKEWLIDYVYQYWRFGYAKLHVTYYNAKTGEDDLCIWLYENVIPDWYYISPFDDINPLFMQIKFNDFGEIEDVIIPKDIKIFGNRGEHLTGKLEEIVRNALA